MQPYEVLRRQIVGARKVGAAIGLAIAVCAGLASCATNLPRRDASVAWDGHTAIPRPSACSEDYAETDAAIWDEMSRSDSSVETRSALDKQIAKAINQQLRAHPEEAKPCWKAAYENHQALPPPTNKLHLRDTSVPAPAYDLLIAEFDDQGERADVSQDKATFENSEVALIEAQLEAIYKEEVNEKSNGGLNIVVFTHGWHGNASATDAYSVWFKAILEQITFLEQSSRRSICHAPLERLPMQFQERGASTLMSLKKAYDCKIPITNVAGEFKPRRTVGIEIAWRGDSEVIPLLTWANFWDRKGAAQTVAQGAVHDLMARLHRFYIGHSCHGGGARVSPSGKPCDAVHMLTVGHSFGALIDWHTLNYHLSTGILGDQAGRAYGLGDLTVFLNPAFEAERLKTLFDVAIHNPAYPDGSRDSPGTWPSRAQMPILVTVQSEADYATKLAFPAARFFSGFFENNPGRGESERSLKASGWPPEYQTHRLVPGRLGGKDNCDYQGQEKTWFCPFDLDHEGPQSRPLTIQKADNNLLPAFFPVWTVAVQRSLMANHDDISDPAIVRFIAQLFRAAYEQEEVLHEDFESSGSHATE